MAPAEGDSGSTRRGSDVGDRGPQYIGVGRHAQIDG
jgi:hypothetical protein